MRELSGLSEGYHKNEYHVSNIHERYQGYQSYHKGEYHVSNIHQECREYYTYRVIRVIIHRAIRGDKGNRVIRV